MFCSNCGSNITDDAKFCLNCGTKVVDFVPPVAPAPVVEATPAPVAAETAQFNNAFQINEPAAPVMQPAPQKPKMPVWVIVLIIVLSLGVLGAAGYLVYDNFFADSYSDSDDDKDDKKDKKKNSSDSDTNGSSEGEKSSDNNSSDNSYDNSSDNTSITTANKNPGVGARPLNSNYTAIYRNNGITEDATPSAITRCDTFRVYGHEVLDGVVEKMEAGYNDGVLTNMRNVVYYTHDALAEQWGGESMVTEANINLLIDQWKQQFAVIHSWEFATR